MGDFCFRDQRAKSDAKNTYSKAHHFQYCVFNFHGACMYIYIYTCMYIYLSYIIYLYISCMQIHILSLDMGNNIHRLYTGFPGWQKPPGSKVTRTAPGQNLGATEPKNQLKVGIFVEIAIYMYIYIYIHDYFKKKDSSGVLFAFLGGGYFNLYIRYLL